MDNSKKGNKWDMLVLAIDPGKTSGFCLAYKSFNSDLPLLVAPYEKVVDVEGMHKELEDYSPDYIICESFAYRPGQSKPWISLISRDLIGVVQLYGKAQDVTVFMQTPAQGMGYFSNEKLKELGLYRRGSEHARDATRHLLYWLNFGSGYQFNVDLRRNELLMPFQLEKMIG